MWDYRCGFCTREDCYGCPYDDKYESPADYYKSEGYSNGYKKGYKDGYEKGKSEKPGLTCVFKELGRNFCGWFDKPCEGCDLSCGFLSVGKDEDHFVFYPGKELEERR